MEHFRALVMWVMDNKLLDRHRTYKIVESDVGEIGRMIPQHTSKRSIFHFDIFCTRISVIGRKKD